MAWQFQAASARKCIFGTSSELAWLGCWVQGRARVGGGVSEYGPVSGDVCRCTYSVLAGALRVFQCRRDREKMAGGAVGPSRDTSLAERADSLSISVLRSLFRSLSSSGDDPTDMSRANLEAWLASQDCNARVARL